MSQPAGSSPRRTACPSCGAAVPWYRAWALFEGGLTCPACQAKLQLRHPARALLGLPLAAAVLAGSLLGVPRLVPVISFGGWLALVVAALLAGMLLFTLVGVRVAGIRAETANQASAWGIAWLSLAVVFVVLSLTLFPPPLESPELPSGPELRAQGKADTSWVLRTLDDREVRLADFEGKVVFLNVWATWCRPCLMEMPSIQDLYKEFKDQGVVFLLVTNEPPEQVRRFVSGRGWELPVYTIPGGVPEVFAAESLPTTFILNRRGEIVFKHVGAVRWDTDDCRRFLRRLL